MILSVIEGHSSSIDFKELDEPRKILSEYVCNNLPKGVMAYVLSGMTT